MSLLLEDISNNESLNIFSDASTKKCKKDRMAAAYAVVAVCKDDFIETEVRIHSDTTVNAEEARGVRTALSIALLHRKEFKRINIFSDSKITIYGLREWRRNWIFKNGQLYSKSTGKLVSNQGLFAEMYMMSEELCRTNILNLYHIKGHITNGNYKNCKDAVKSFKNENKIYDNVDINLIRYLTTYNNHVDSLSRNRLNTSNVYKNLEFRDAVEFYPTGPLR